MQHKTALWTHLSCRALTLTFAALFLVSGAVSRAQTAVDGAVTGTVEDASGAAIPNATVLVHSTATNADSSIVSDASGYFHVSRLSPGDYTVKVHVAGFADYTANHVIVEVGKSTEIGPRLSAGSTSTTVEVSAEAPVINSENSDFTSEFTPTTLKSLPINGRHWTSFALLTPGATMGNSAFGLVTFRGATNLQNNFMVDGSDDNQSFQSVERGYTRVVYSTTEDAILEFQVLTSNVSAQYGRAVGGGVNAITRSGSNTFHGDLFEYWRDNEFGATNPFNILQTVPTTVYIKPLDKRHQFGGSGNGPIIHDKLFFLYAFDEQRRDFPVVAVPTPQFLAATNASYNNCKVFGTTTTTDAVTCAEDRGVTPAQITAAENYISGQSGVAPRQGNQTINFGKIDYKLNDRNMVSGMYNRMRWTSPNGTQTNPVIRRGLTSIGNDYVTVDAIIGKIDTFLTPRISNEFRAEWARDNEVETGNTPLSNEPTTTANGLPPGVIISSNSGFSMGTPYYVPRSSYPSEQESDVVDNVSITQGKHTFNVGGEFRWAQDNITDVDYEHGLFTYAQLADWFTDFAYAMGNNVFCDAARDTAAGGTLPCYTNLQQAYGHPTFVYHTNDWAGYAQDDWKIKPTFTLNLGVRYDYEQTPSAKIPNTNPQLTQTGQLPSDKTNFAPRVGFAWDAYKDGKTVFHGGFGMYYGRIQNGTIYKALASTGSPSAQFQLNSSPTTVNPPRYPNIVPIGPSNAPAVSNITAFAPGFKNPFAYEADFSVQQQLGWNTVLGIAYLGSFGRQLPTFVDANIAPATTSKTYSFVNGPLAGDKWTVPVYTTRLNSTFNALTLISSTITSNYNALSATLDHRLSQGIQIQVSYTFSKALDTGMNQSALSDANDQTDPFTTAPDYGRSVNDVPQRIVGSIVLAPKFPTTNRAASVAANGWSLTPVWTLQSGIPYSYQLSGGTSIPGGATTYNGSGGVGASTAQYVDFKAYPQYASLDSFVTGVSPYRNSARQTSILDVDTRLSRTFTFHEKYNLMLAAESFNIMNRQNFTAYNTGAYNISGTTATYQGTFGTPSAAGNTILRERQVQFVGRFEF